MGKTRQILSTCLFSSKIWKNILSLIMMKTIRVRLKMEFLHYNCFPAITKLIAGLHYTLPNPEQMLWSYWKTDILKLDYSHSTCAISKECVKIWQKHLCWYRNNMKVFGNTASRNILQCYALIGFDATLRFYKIGKTLWFKDVFKKSSCLGLVFM